MNTDALIRALALDAARPVVPVRTLVSLALAGGALGSLVLFLLWLHPRPDLAQAWYSPGFLLKLAAAAGLAATSATLLGRVARPQRRRGAFAFLALPPLLLAAGVAVELATVPGEMWHARLIGRNAPHCLALIPTLACTPACLLMLALRRTAPAHPGLAGAVIGLTAGGIGACLYALTCPDDSPLFVAAWYSLAILVVTGACFIVGRRCLRW
jgi:hypothetical protein